MNAGPWGFAGGPSSGGGTVTSVTASLPLHSSGGTTPNITADSTVTFVFRAGGGTGYNVYGTWAALMSAMNSTAIQAGSVRFLTLDGSGGPLHATVGTWNIDNLRIVTKTKNGGSLDDLTVDDGCVFLFDTIYVADGATLISQSASPVFNVIDADDLIVLEEGASIQSAGGAAPFIHVAAGFSINIGVESYSSLGDGSNPVVNVSDPTANVNLVCFDGGRVNSHAVTGTGSYAALISSDGFVDPTQDNVGGVGLALSSDATRVAYSPFVPGDWTIVPTQVAEALDELAARPSPVAPNATWTRPDWYIDPVGGLDTNSGATALLPVKTVMGGIVAKWGTTAPVLAQDTTLHLLAGETLGQENVVLAPVLVAANLIVLGTRTVLSASFSPSVVTAKVRGTPGVRLQIAIGGLVAGQLVRNLTRGSRAFVHSVAGAVATMTQPFMEAGLTTVSPTPALVEDNGWANTDNYELSSVPLLNLKVTDPEGGDQNGAFTKGTFWVQDVFVPDVSGAPGGSQYTPFASACTIMFMSCWIDPFFTLDGQLAVTRPWAGGCFLNGGATVDNGAAAVGGSAGAASGYGCTVRGASVVDGDIIVHGASDMSGLCGYAYVDGAINMGHENEPLGIYPIQLATGGGASAQLWGPGTLNAGEAAGSIVQNSTGGTWAACLTLSALTVDGQATASAFDAGALGNPFTPGIAVTGANLDTYNGLQNPRTGSRFAGT